MLSLFELVTFLLEMDMMMVNRLKVDLLIYQHRIVQLSIAQHSTSHFHADLDAAGQYKLRSSVNKHINTTTYSKQESNNDNTNMIYNKLSNT